MDAEHVRPRRSCLYIPGSNPRAIEKAASLAADAVILDLEDAVAPGVKDEARYRVCDAVSGRAFGGREVIIRINGLDTPRGSDDVAAAVAAGPDAILAPKVASARDVYALDTAIADAGCEEGAALWAMIEVSAAVLNCREIAAAGEDTRLTVLVLGSNDLAKEVGVRLSPRNDALAMAAQWLLLSARAYGLAAIDGVFNDIGDTSGLDAACLQARNWGFDGKTLIHPSQIEAANRVFAPDPAEVDWAQKVVAAFSQPENQSAGVLSLDGVMTERLHLAQAEQLLAVHERIKRCSPAGEMPT